MEEPKAPVAVAATQHTLHTQTLTTRKRPLDSNSNSNSNSNYFKIRALVRDLRPHFIQVLQTPDYKNCKASHEIRDQLKIVLKVYNDMKADVVSLKQLPQRFKSPEQTQVEKAFARPSVGEDSHTSGTYVIGGSAFGWNFITFTANDSVYYGRTKEQFRLQKKTE